MTLCRVFCTISLYLLLVKIISGNPSTGADIVVETDCGYVQGVSENYSGRNLYSFKGIPYAGLLLGKNRWTYSQLLSEANECWDGTLQATDFGNVCVQNVDVGAEDCLFLNVWTTILNSTSKLPVLVYIHGGSLVAGSGNDINPWHVALDGGVVAVSINYRLNVFGFLSLVELASPGLPSTGNYGFSDQITALRWVQRNIAGFGGDPARVTIFGQSSGGTSIFGLLVSPLARNLYHGAISMSGSARISSGLSESQNLHKITWLANTRCANVKDVKECLYSLSSNEIFSAMPPSWLDTVPETFFGIPFPGATATPLAIIDGTIIKADLYTSLGNSNYRNDVPLIIGVMREESDIAPVDIVTSVENFIDVLRQRTAKFPQANSLVNQILQRYNPNNFDAPQQCYDQISTDIHFLCENIFTSSLASKNFKSSVYMYVAIHKPSPTYCPGDGYCPRFAFHTWDLQALTYAPQDITDPDKQFGDVLLDGFVSLASTGKIPKWKLFTTPTENPEFPRNDAGDYNIMIIDTDYSVSMNYKQELCSFWAANNFTEYWIINK